MEKKEIKTFTEQDMVDFANWIADGWHALSGEWESTELNTERKPKYLVETTNALFEIWKSQRVPEIKTTSELGCMLDTERTWNTDINLIQPNDTRDVEVMLKDGTITFGWLGGCWWVDDKKGYERSSHFPEENPNNPVVAWRELVTDNK